MSDHMQEMGMDSRMFLRSDLEAMENSNLGEATKRLTC